MSKIYTSDLAYDLPSISYIFLRVQFFYITGQLIPVITDMLMVNSQPVFIDFSTKFLCQVDLRTKYYYCYRYFFKTFHKEKSYIVSVPNLCALV